MNKNPSHLKTGVIGLIAGFFGSIIGLILITPLRWYLDWYLGVYGAFSFLVYGFPLYISDGVLIVLIGGPLFGIIGAFVGLKRRSSRLWLWSGISGFLINLFFSVWSI